MRACKKIPLPGVHHERHRTCQSPVRADDRRPRARRDAASGGGRPDVRHGRLSAAAVLRCDPSARAAALSDQRRAHRRLRGGCLCAGHRPARRARPAQDAVERAAALLAQAKRPLVLVGGGVHLSGAHRALQELAGLAAMPVAHTMSGKGAIACTHALSAGLFGRYSRIANDLIAASDCLLVVGCKLGEIATKRYALLPAGVPIIHLDILAEEIGRCAPAQVTLWGDAREGLVDLAEALRADAARLRATRADYVAELPRRRAKWREEAAARLGSTERPIHMARLVAEMNRALPAESILIADGGFAAHWTGLIYDTKAAGRHYIPDRGLASIGYGLPGGIGAALAAPDQPVVALTGDGGFNMTIGELETARRTGANNLTAVIVNNAASGYVKALQHSMFGKRYQSSDLVEMDYAAVADAMGCRGIRVEDPEQLGEALRKGMAERD